MMTQQYSQLRRDATQDNIESVRRYPLSYNLFQHTKLCPVIIIHYKSMGACELNPELECQSYNDQLYKKQQSACSNHRTQNTLQPAHNPQASATQTMIPTKSNNPSNNTTVAVGSSEPGSNRVDHTISAKHSTSNSAYNTKTLQRINSQRSFDLCKEAKVDLDNYMLSYKPQKKNRPATQPTANHQASSINYSVALDRINGRKTNSQFSKHESPLSIRDQEVRPTDIANPQNTPSLLSISNQSLSSIIHSGPQIKINLSSAHKKQQSLRPAAHDKDHLFVVQQNIQSIKQYTNNTRELQIGEVSMLRGRNIQNPMSVKQPHRRQ